MRVQDRWGGSPLCTGPGSPAWAPPGEALRPYPDILLLADGEVRIQVYNFWCSVHGCSIPRDLKIQMFRDQVTHKQHFCFAQMPCNFPNSTTG
jgi:hypothetical protein